MISANCEPRCASWCIGLQACLEPYLWWWPLLLKGWWWWWWKALHELFQSRPGIVCKVWKGAGVQEQTPRSIFATSERSSWSGLTEKLSLLRLSLTALSPLEKSIFKLEALCNLLWRSAWSTFDHPYRILRLSTPVHSIFHRVLFNFKSIYRNEIVDTLLFILPPPCFAWQWTSPVGKVCCSCCCCCCLPSFSLSLVQMWGGVLTRCGGYNVVSVEFGVIVAWCVWVEIGLKGLERFPLVLVVILATEKDVGNDDWWWWWWWWWR